MPNRISLNMAFLTICEKHILAFRVYNNVLVTGQDFQRQTGNYSRNPKRKLFKLPLKSLSN